MTVITSLSARPKACQEDDVNLGYEALRDNGVPPQVATVISDSIEESHILATIQKFAEERRTVGELVQYLDWRQWQVFLPRTFG
jgi:hypothetical protein